jgi:3-oxoadipate enol-lactonase / 4-carboxymuconolactone decarboxylase
MFLRVGELTVHVDVQGAAGAPPLLLLHSLGTSLHVWDAQVASLAQRFRVIRPDMRGHGLTGVTPGPYSIAGLAHDALAVLDELGIGRAHVAGVSIGGLIAQSIAAQAPDRLLSLALCDTAMAIPPPETWRERAAIVRAQGVAALVDAVLARWVTPGFLGTPETAGLRAMLLRTPAEGYAAAAEAIASADLSASTREIRVPTLVLVGEQDQATPVASAEALRDAIPGAVLHVIADASHIPMVEKPAEVTAALLDFLAPAASGDRYADGLAVRRQVLGEAHVARASSAITAFDRDFQHYITENAWGGVWTRPHFDRRTRSLLTLAILAALGHHEEFRLHVRATRNTGATAEDIAEMLLHVAVYAGIPAANSAVRLAKEILKEMEAS